MKGKYPRDYFQNPHIKKPIEEIWNDIDSYSGEYFEDEPQNIEVLDFVIPLPPLDYKGKITKGICFTQGCEYLLKTFPELQKIFFVGAYTMWSSYSWCDRADFYLSCYENKPRELWHKNKYKRKKDIFFIPLQDADFTNEYYIAPTFYEKKVIDILSVATPFDVKNLPILGSAMRVYKKKYGKSLKATFIIGVKDAKKNKNGDYIIDNKDDQKNLDALKISAGDCYKDITIVPWSEYNLISKYYSSARCTVLCSLIEGKNRSIHESMCCNTPVVVFKDHNKWARGDHPVFFENSGEYAQEFTPESLADAIHKVISNPDYYEPRKNILKYSGRKNFVNKIVDTIPYFRENLPCYEPNRLTDNLWVDLAMQENYQLGFMDFLYGKNQAIQHVRGISEITKLIEFFYLRFNINH